MSTQQPANLAEMVRERAKNRGNALAYEFEGRQTTFAEFDVKTNKVANALIAMGLRPYQMFCALSLSSSGLSASEKSSPIRFISSEGSSTICSMFRSWTY